jgi:hypothetical protein
LSNTLTQPRVNVLGHVSVDTKLFVKSPYLLASFQPPNPSFKGIHKVRKFYLGMKCWKSAFNAQGSRLIIVALQVGAMKIYATIVQALKKRKDRVKLSSPQKLKSHHPWILMFLFFGNLTLLLIKLRVLVFFSLLCR